MPGQVPPNGTDSIFRAYDIRGIYKQTLDEGIMERIGRAFSGLIEGDTVVLARDGRLSGESLVKAFIRGVISTGRNVDYLGVLPLGAGMFHAWKNGKTFAYVTASHLGKEWNGLKFFKGTGLGFMEDDLERVRKRFLKDNPAKHQEGRLINTDRDDVIRSYIKHLHSIIKPGRNLSVVLDTGNGAAGVLARKLFSDAGFKTLMVSEDVDGSFPSRPPDPVKDELKEMRKSLDGRDLGIAYDGDGDRMVVMDELGRKLSPEQISYILLTELLKTSKGPIVANVETTKTIDMIAERFKRHVHRVRVGHNYLMKGTFEKGACFGMEPSGHYAVPSIFPFDDSLAISYYFACLLSRRSEPLSSLAGKVPGLPFQRTSFDVPDDRKFHVMEKIAHDLKSRYHETSTLDGVRVELEEGWVLIRPSNTQPKIRLTVEASTEKDLESLKREFSSILEKYINP